ncbi:MAG: hypothetical protein H0X47_03615 [Nitrospirales bacterium]|nr:hypothetical protein [Nitrospirales bacterium]
MVEKFYNKVLPDLRGKTEERGYLFYSQGTPGTLMAELLDELGVHLGVRFPFGIEAACSVIVGFIVTLEPERKQSEKAWNRFEEVLRKRISKAEREGYKDKSLAFVIIQIWEREKSCVLIPFKELNGIMAFQRKGDFTVLKDCGEFFLQKPSYEPKIRLKDKLGQIFEYL